MGKWDSSDDENVEDKKVVKKQKKTSITETSKSIDVVIQAVEVLEDGEEAPTVASKINDDELSKSPKIEQLSPIKGSNTPKASTPNIGAESPFPAANTVATIPAKVIVQHNPLYHGCRSVDEYIRLNFIDQGTYGVVFRYISSILILCL